MMTRFFRGIAVVLAISLSGPAIADAFKAIMTEAAFREQVVGKKLMFGKDHLSVRATGKVSGRFGSKSLKGAWPGAINFGAAH